MGIDVAAFWISMAAIVAVWAWRQRHTEALRHETLRAMIQSNENIDEKLLNEVLNPPIPENRWTRVAMPGQAYRVFRFLGSLVMIASPGVGMIATIATYFDQEAGLEILLPIGVGAGLVALIAGMALFFAANFLEKPAGRQ